MENDNFTIKNQSFWQNFDWIRNPNWQLVEKRSKVKSLLESAKISDRILPHIEPVGYGKLLSARISVLDNFPSNRRNIVEITVVMFHDAIGIYKSRII